MYSKKKTYLSATLTTTNPNELAWDLNRATELKGRGEVGPASLHDRY